MLGSALILYKVITLILFKEFIMGNCCEFYELYSKHFNTMMHASQDKPRNQWNDKKKYIFYHDYDNANRAVYQDSVYIVKPGDTLFYIAWITGNDYLDLAKNNNIKNINILKIGQILKIKNNTVGRSLFFKKLSKKVFLPFYISTYKMKKIFFKIKKNFLSSKIKKYILFNTDIRKNITIFSKKSDTIMLNNWGWPTNGKIINMFSDTEGGNKGIDISGVFNQPIVATTNGQVVYVGNVLQGYGNLIVIKHDNNYLSAYAHNNKILVTEQQKVKIGDQIATMGDSGTNIVKLHFEIRHEGKSINPLILLPK